MLSFTNLARVYSRKACKRKKQRSEKDWLHCARCRRRGVWKAFVDPVWELVALSQTRSRQQYENAWNADSISSPAARLTDPDHRGLDMGRGGGRVSRGPAPAD